MRRAVLCALAAGLVTAPPALAADAHVDGRCTRDLVAFTLTNATGPIASAPSEPAWTGPPELLGGAKEQLRDLIAAIVSATRLPPPVKALILQRLAGLDPDRPAHKRLICIGLRLLDGTPWQADARRVRAALGCAG